MWRRGHLTLVQFKVEQTKELNFFYLGMCEYTFHLIYRPESVEAEHLLVGLYVGKPEIMPRVRRVRMRTSQCNDIRKTVQTRI